MVSAAFPNRPFNLRENVWFIGNEVGNNRSLVGFQLWIDKTGNSPTYAFSGKTHRWFQLDGGFVYQNYNTGFDFRGAGPWLIAEGQAWINHNADGSKYMSIAAAADYEILGATSVNSGFWLPQIPRASNATFAGDNILDAGVTETINTNRASGSFTHDIDYYFGSASGRAVTGAGASGTWTVPMSLLNQIPNSTRGAGKIRTHTYNGGTMIGWTETGFELTALANVVPNWTGVSISEANSLVTTHVGNKYVQGLSKLNYAITGASAPYSATVTTQQLIVEGQTVNGATGVTPLPIAGSGTIPVKHKIVDSRGRIKEQTTNIDVLPYSRPAVTSYQIRRSLSDGTLDIDDGTSLRIDLVATAASLINGTQRNILQIKAYYKLRSSSTWTLGATINPAGGAITYNSFFVIAGPFAVASAYDVRLEIIDRFSTSTINQSLSSAPVFMHWSPTGVGIGTYHTNGRLHVSGDAYVNGGSHRVGKVFTDCNAITSGWIGEFQIRPNTNALNIPSIPNAQTYAWSGIQTSYVAYTGDPQATQVIQEIWRMDVLPDNYSVRQAAMGVSYVRWRNGTGGWSQWFRKDDRKKLPTAMAGGTWNYLENRINLTAGAKVLICDGIFTTEFIKYRIDYYYWTGTANGNWFRFRAGGADIGASPAAYTYSGLHNVGGAAGAFQHAAAQTQLGMASVGADSHHGYIEIDNPMYQPGTTIQKGYQGFDSAGSASGNTYYGGWMGGYDNQALDGFKIALSDQGGNGWVAGSWVSVQGIA